MAQAELSQASGEVMSPRLRSRAASLEAALAPFVEIPAALLVLLRLSFFLPVWSRDMSFMRH